MGLNEDLGDRENVGSAAVATQRHREAREKDRLEAEKFANWMIEVVNADHHDKIEFNRDIGCRIRDHIDNLRRDLATLSWKPITSENLPKVGDEIGCYRLPMVSGREPFWIHQGYVKFDGFDTCEKIREYGWTHFRPINPPKESK